MAECAASGARFQYENARYARDFRQLLQSFHWPNTMLTAALWPMLAATQAQEPSPPPPPLPGLPEPSPPPPPTPTPVPMSPMRPPLVLLPPSALRPKTADGGRAPPSPRGSLVASGGVSTPAVVAIAALSCLVGIAFRSAVVPLVTPVVQRLSFERKAIRARRAQPLKEVSLTNVVVRSSA